MSTTTPPSALGTGVYSLVEAAYLLGMDEDTVLRWSSPHGGKEALVAPSHGWAFSFHDLVSVAVIAVLRQRKVSPSGVRTTIAYLQEKFDTPRPFAHRDVVRELHTAGSSVLWTPNVDVSKGGQLTFIETVTNYLKPIEYGSNRLARLWRPERQIVLDPEIQVGRPCIEGTRVTTEVVASRFLQGESRGDISDDLQITIQQVSYATKFEKRLRNGKGLALVA